MRWVPLVAITLGCAPRSVPFADGVVAAGAASLHLHCMGAGEPTVVLDAGLGNDGSVWGDVQYAIAEKTRACVYDRAGLGYSAPPPAGPRTSAVLVAELGAALHGANISGPLVLVGHSFGGLDVQLFAQTHGAAGLVLVDAMSAEQEARYWALLPPAARDDFAASLAPSPERIDLAALRASMAEVRASRQDLGAMPLVVLTHGKAEPAPPGVPEDVAESMERAWSAMQDDLVTLSRNGAHLVEPRSGHFLQRDAPDLVTAAILETCRAARLHDHVDARRIRKGG